MADVACRDGSVFRPSNISLGPGRRSGQDGEQEIREKITFCLIALDPDNRLRYPPVSLFFGMWWWFWLARDVWENLFGIEFAKVKVGS